MNIILFIIVAAISWVVGVFGWAQVIGGFQNIKNKGPIMLITIVLWLAIISGTLVIVLKFFAPQIWAWGIGMLVSFIQVIKSGRIE